MDFLLFHNYFIFSLAMVINIAIIVLNFIVLWSLLNKSFGFHKRFFKKNAIAPIISLQSSIINTNTTTAIQAHVRQSAEISTTASAASNAFLISLCFSGKFLKVSLTMQYLLLDYINRPFYLRLTIGNICLANICND